jgi:hypothetical protein
MADNFRACDRNQAFLLPPEVRDWLPSDHLAWFLLDVDQLAIWSQAAGVRQACSSCGDGAAGATSRVTAAASA